MKLTVINGKVPLEPVIGINTLAVLEAILFCVALIEMMHFAVLDADCGHCNAFVPYAIPEGNEPEAGIAKYAAGLMFACIVRVKLFALLP